MMHQVLSTRHIAVNNKTIWSLPLEHSILAGEDNQYNNCVNYKENSDHSYGIV